MDAKEFLDRLVKGNAETILTIMESDRPREEKLKAVEGLINLAIVRAQQIERGQIRPPFDGSASAP